MEMERQQHSRTPQANDPKRDRNSGQRSMGHIEANSRAEGQEDSRRRTISFSSEEPYRRWFGMEILDHAENAPDLSRLNDVGVLLFNHDTDKVVGKVIRAWVENHRGMAEVEFDTDDDAEKIFGKVKSGSATISCWLGSTPSGIPTPPGTAATTRSANCRRSGFRIMPRCRSYSSAWGASGKKW